MYVDIYIYIYIYVCIYICICIRTCRLGLEAASSLPAAGLRRVREAAPARGGHDGQRPRRPGLGVAMYHNMI